MPKQSSINFPVAIYKPYILASYYLNEHGQR